MEDATTTASSVSATMITRKVRLPNRSDGAGRDSHVAEDPGHGDQARGRDHAAERAPHDQQQASAPMA